jgi:Zn-dependent protease/predicted transcriptional regulator
MYEEKNMAPQKPGMNSINLFKVAGIQIDIHYSWFIIFLLVVWSLSAGYFPHQFPHFTTQAYWIAGLIATLFFFLSIVIHELAHSIMANHLGIEIKQITLFIFGGISQLTSEAKKPRDELLISVVGPLTSIILGIIFWMGKILVHTYVSAITSAVFDYLAWINVFLGIFNLIPGFPLDGGRVLRAIAWWKTGSPNYAIRLSTDMGKGFALGFIVLGALEIFTGGLVEGLWLVLIGMYLRSMANAGFEEYVFMHTLGDMKVKQIMIEDVVGVPPDISVNRLITDFFFHSSFREFPVISEGKILGIISLDNLQSLSEEERKNRTVEEVMIPLNDDIIISQNETLSDALHKMMEKGSNRLLVMDAGQLKGILTKNGVIRLLELKKSA